VKSSENIVTNGHGSILMAGVLAYWSVCRAAGSDVNGGRSEERQDCSVV